MRSPRLVAIALSFAAAGCSWSDLDAEFLAGMPERDDLHVHPPTETAATQQGLQSGELGQSQSGLQADAFLNLDNTAKQLNAWIDGLTGGLDLVRQFPPSVRAESKRTWGPWDDKDHPGMELQVVASLDEATGQYGYGVEWRDQGSAGGFTPVITGSFTGAKATGGNGSFTLHMDQARALGIAGPNADPKYEVQSFTLAYSHPEGGVKVDLSELVVETGTGDPKTFQFSHQRNSDQSGAFHYTFTMPRNGYEVSADAKWLSNRAGRVDGTGYSTFFQKIVANHTECWDEDLQVVYRFQDYECGAPFFPDEQCETGDRTKCAVPAP
ncbi:MAG TPA: hypothetical protein VGK67_38620 [Myxococcales bacterium]|jgi:hypothetical protein